MLRTTSDRERSIPSGPIVSASPPPPARRRWRASSATRLASLHALVLVTVLGGSVVALTRNSRAGNEQIAAAHLAAELRTFSQAAVARPAGQDLFVFAEGYLRTHAVASGDAIVIGIAGRGTVGSPGSTRVLEDPAIEARLTDPPTRSTTASTRVGGIRTEVLTAPLVDRGRTVGTFVGTGDLSMFGSVEHRILTVSLVEALIALLVGVASAFLLARRLLRTVGRITATADAFGEGRLDERLGDQGTGDEIDQLAQSFDAMLDRVQAAVAAQRRLLSDVSHQLRTPLTVARGHLEVLTRTDVDDPNATVETVELVLDELEHMRTEIERLSLLGQAMEPDALSIEPVEVRLFLNEIHEACPVLADREWLLPTPPAACFAADAAKLRGAVLNLVDNAVNVTAVGDAIEVSATVSRDSVRISVGDSGPGIPAAQRAAVLARFARPGARDADGSGLGLAIVKAIAEAHRGRVELGSSRLGGAEITIVLPLGMDEAACAS